MEARRTANLGFLQGGGKAGALMRAVDWTSSPLGSPSDWPQPLKTLTSVMLGSNQPMFVAWGADRTLLYNDPYAEILAAKHPAALGSDFLDVWHEIRADLVPIVEQAYAGEPVHMDDIELIMHRKGYPEETHFAFSYTPVRDESGAVGGFFCPCVEITEQVLADRRMAEERERQQRMLQQMPGFAAMLSGPDHRYEYVNDAYRELAGVREFVGRTVREVFPDIAGQGFYELLDRVFGTGETFAARAMSIKLKDGERFMDLLYEPIRDEAGHVTGIFVGGYDVTDQVQTEAELRSSEARYRMLFESIESGFCVVEVELDAPGGRIDYRVVEANPAFYRQTTFTKAILGRWLRDAAPELEEHWYEVYGKVARTGEPQRFEQGSDILGRWFDVYAFRMGDPADRRVAILFNDISARRNAEQRLRELNETLERRVAEAIAERKLLADIVEGTDAFVQVADLDFRWLAINTAAANEFERVFAVRPSVGQSMLDVLDDRPEHREAVRGVWARALAGEEFTEIGEFGDPNYGRRYYEMKYNVLRDEQGAQIGAYQFVYDVTQRIAEQRRLAQAEESLRQAQKMEAVGQLTGGIAHDFNNMLAVVIGSLDLLKRRTGTVDARARRYVDAATDGARRAALLTQRLLAFSRQQPLKPEPVDANRLVAGLSELLRRSLGSDVRLETVLAGGLWRTHADPNQLENVLLNLAVNARDAMPDGGRLTIETQNAHLDGRYAAAQLGVSAGQYVLIAVTDTGSGMPDEVIAKAFDPFFTTKEVGKGTGLGLSQVYGFVKQSGGHVKIYSEQGQGTTVKVYLPRLAGSDHDAVQDGISSDVPLGEAQEVILVVEDEPAVRQFSVDALTELGYGVLEADGATAALRLLDSHPEIEMLFTDVVMPDVNGRKLADEARRHRPDLKVLFTTGYTRNAVVHNGVLDPGVELIGKPFTIEELAAKVREVLDTSAAC